MSSNQKSTIRKIVDANKDLVKITVGKTQEVAMASVDYNREIWLAGLGAFTQARKEGNRAFDKLVERGQEFEERTRDMIENKTVAAKKKIEESFDKVSNPSNSLEDIFDNRVARAIKKMGIPTAKTLKSLSEQLLEVSEKLNKISDKKETEEAVAQNEVAEKEKEPKKPAKSASKQEAENKNTKK